MYITMPRSTITKTNQRISEYKRLNNVMIFLFTAGWGTATLLEILWTFIGILALFVSFGSSIRDFKNILRLREYKLDGAREVAAKNFLVRHSIKSIIFLVCIFTGIIAMTLPQSKEATSSAAVGALTIFVVEIMLMVTVISDELAHHRIIYILGGERRTDAEIRNDRPRYDDPMISEE